jgi:hypothetical protein
MKRLAYLQTRAPGAWVAEHEVASALGERALHRLGA